jgi:peptide/nickel transport system permease protein
MINRKIKSIDNGNEELFVEYIFGWNGLGKLTVEALNQLDVPVVMGCVLCFALLFIVLNKAVDRLYKLLDPRIDA